MSQDGLKRSGGPFQREERKSRWSAAGAIAAGVAAASQGNIYLAAVQAKLVYKYVKN